MGEKAPLPDMPKHIQIMRDHKGNTVQIGKDIGHESALQRMSEGYDIQLFTYILQPVRKIVRDTP